MGERATASECAKTRLLGLLQRSAPRYGLTASAIETLVAGAQLTYWRRAGERIFLPGDAQDMVYLVVAGAIKICCPGQTERKIVAHLVAPGRFFSGRWLVDRPGRQCWTAVVHVPSVIAMISGRTVDNVLRGLPASRVLRFMTRRCRVLSRALVRKSVLLALPVRDRLLCELAALGHDFGERRENGILIRLPMTHEDLAELVGATRTSVTRCLGELRAEGRLRIGRGVGAPGMLLVAA